MFEKPFRYLIPVLFMLVCSYALAAPAHIVVSGLSAQSALVKIDGVLHKLNVGQEYKGVRLLSVQNNMATMFINGQKITLAIGHEKWFADREAVTLENCPVLK